MNSLPDREHAVVLINEAISNGAGKAKACLEAGITIRTYNRWVKRGNVIADGRPTAQRVKPKNALTDLERQTLLNIANSEAYKSLPPSQIVPALADKGLYMGSESTFYRVLREAGQQHHRGRSKKPTSKPISTHQAQKPNQVWCSGILRGYPALLKGFTTTYI